MIGPSRARVGAGQDAGIFGGTQFFFIWLVRGNFVMTTGMGIWSHCFWKIASSSG